MASKSGKTSKGKHILPYAYVQEMTNDGIGEKYICGQKSLIGRNMKAEIPIPSCNVSRNHVYLEWIKDKGWCITDNRSVNGVYLNDQKLKPDIAHPIKSGQKIFLGPPTIAEYWLEFHSDPHQKHDEGHSGIKMGSQSKITSKVGKENPGYVGSSSNARENNSARQTRSCQKRTLHTESPRCSQKKYCSDTLDSESASLEERLAAVDTLIKMNEALDKRVKRILNQSAEALNGTQDTPTQESTSLLHQESGEIPSSHTMSDPPAAETDWWELTQKSSQKSSSNNDEIGNTTTQKKFSEQELCELKEKVAALEKELQDRESALQKQLKEKQLLLEEQEQQKKNSEEEKLKSNIKETSSLQKAVCKEVANQFGELMESELTCVICAELFVKATTLDCGHSFCSDCITTWKKTRKMCPMCRQPISGMSKSIVIDNFIEKMVEKLSTEDQERRKQLINERNKDKTKTNKKKQNSRSNTTRRNTRQTRNVRRDPVIPEIMVADSTSWGPSFSIGAIISPIDDDIVEMDFQSAFFDSDDDSSVEGNGYYGGYGRCYNCGRSGHWANGCPDI